MSVRIDPQRTALLGLHWMKDIIHPGGAVGAMFSAAVAESGIVANAQRLWVAARAAGLTIGHTRIAFRPGYTDMVASAPLYEAVRATGGCLLGTPGAEVIDELKPVDGDLDVPHNRVCGFVGSSLDLMLRARRVETLLLTGVATNITVESTARYASDLGYRVVVVSDCTVSNTPEAHQASLATLSLIAEVADSSTVIGAL